jgi:hypothetical protein
VAGVPSHRVVQGVPIPGPAGSSGGDLRGPINLKCGARCGATGFLEPPTAAEDFCSDNGDQVVAGKTKLREDSMLTVKQLLAIATHRLTPPWRVGDLRAIFKVESRTLSLRAILNGVQGGSAVVFVKVLDASVLKSVTTIEQLQAIWKSSTPTRETWTKLSQILGSVGGSMKLLSNDWKSVGVTGRIGSLAELPILRIDGGNIDGVKVIETGVGGEAALLIGFLAASEPAGLIFLIAAVGSVAFGSLTGIGIAELFDDGPQATIPGPAGDPNGQFPDTSIYGPMPSGSTPTDVSDAPPTDPNNIPDAPPDPEPPPDPGP